MVAVRENAEGARWLVLIHHIPPKPAYFRAKVSRRLQKLGAVAIKNSVYVLPRNEGTQEDLQWLAREIVTEGGDASLCEASFVEGLRNDQIETFFNHAREADYAALAGNARDAARAVPSRLAADDERRARAEAELSSLEKQVTEIRAIDFFGAPGREAAEAAVSALTRRLARPARGPAKEVAGPLRPKDYRARTWVTRKNVHVDRIASAWLVRRFVDADATFKFVPGQGYKKQSAELTFDMLDADFTHVGDACTFEVLVDRFGLRDGGLPAIAEIIHDIDVKDAKFKRAEVSGVAALIAGIALAEPDDEARIALGGRMFDALLELFRRKRGAS